MIYSTNIDVKMMKYMRGYMIVNGFAGACGLHSNQEPYNMTRRGGGGGLKSIIYFPIFGEGL